MLRIVWMDIVFCGLPATPEKMHGRKANEALLRTNKMVESFWRRCYIHPGPMPPRQQARRIVYCLFSEDQPS